MHSGRLLLRKLQWDRKRCVEFLAALLGWGGRGSYEGLARHGTTLEPHCWYPHTLEFKLTLHFHLLTIDCIFGEIGMILVHLLRVIAVSRNRDLVSCGFACYYWWLLLSRWLEVVVGLRWSTQLKIEVIRSWVVKGSRSHPHEVGKENFSGLEVY